MVAVSASAEPAPPQQLNFPRVGFAILGILVASCLALALGLGLGVRGGDATCLAWAVLAAAIALIPLAIDIARPPDRRHIFLSLLSITYTASFVLPVLTHYIPATGPMDPPAMSLSNLYPADIARAQWIAIVGLLAFYLGYSAPIGSAMRSVLPTHGYEWTHRSALIGTLMLTAVGWVIYAGRATGIIPASLGSGILGGITSATLFGSALLMAIHLKFRSRTALLLLAIVLPITMSINFMTGSKTAILMPPAMVVMTWVVAQRRIRVRWIFAGILAITLVYPAAKFWRQDILNANTLTIGHVLQNPGPALARTARFVSSGRVADYFSEGFESTGNRLDAVGISSVIIRDTPTVSPFQNGRTLALIPIAWVPRALWPDKPVITIGRWITETYRVHGYLLESSLAPGWIGEFYLNFGIPGVLGGMLILGLLLRAAHEMLLGPRRSILLVVAAVIVISRASLGIEAGIVGAINTPIVTLIPLFLMHMLLRIFGGVRRVSLLTSWSTESPRGPDRRVSHAA